MFSYCTALTKAPELPATTLADYCYDSMFYACSGLTTAPALPALELKNKCYSAMFKECASLTTAPTLPAASLQANNCYYGMFDGCTKLKSLTCLATSITGSNCITEWMKEAGSDVTETKTFYRSQSVDDSFWSGNIGTGWTIQPAQ